MLGLPGDNPAAQPLYFGASGAHQHSASEFYLVVAVALPAMLLFVIGLRILSAPARWAGRGHINHGGWAWRAPYEVLVIAFPVAAMAVGEWLAIVALASGTNRSIGANELILAVAAGLLAMGFSGVRAVAGDRPRGGVLAMVPSGRTEPSRRGRLALTPRA